MSLATENAMHDFKSSVDALSNSLRANEENQIIVGITFSNGKLERTFARNNDRDPSLLLITP